MDVNSSNEGNYIMRRLPYCDLNTSMITVRYLARECGQQPVLCNVLE